MNSAELVTALAQRLKLSKTEAGKRLDDTVAVITEELIKNNIVSLTGFGTLEVKKRNERISVQPSTGKRLLIPPKLVLKYKPSSSLNKKLKEMKP